MQLKYPGKKLIGVTSLIFFCCVCSTIRSYNNIQRSLRYEDEDVKGKCFIVGATAMGIDQWGNGVYYYMSVINYLLRKGASYVRLESTAGRIPIGAINIAGVPIGPGASEDFDESNCNIIHGGREYHDYNGAMWDFITLRDQWDNMVKDWTVGPSINRSPFETDFGVYPSLEEVTSSVGVNLEEVIVLHIRQGDVMWLVNEQTNFGHSQPPCAYYEDVIETGYDGKPFPFVLIITNKIRDKNPIFINICDQYLEEKYSKSDQATKILPYHLISRRLFTKDSHAGKAGDLEGLRKDLFILTEAVNVAEGHSTFTMGTVMFGYNLKRHFYPSAPATINSLAPTTNTLDGLILYQRQFYVPGVEQTLYILDGWLGFDGSCKVYEGGFSNIGYRFQVSAAKEA